MKLKILYEDNHLIAVDKEAGVAVQPDKSNEMSLIESVKDYLREKYGKGGNVFLGSVHRIDKPVSGAIIFCKSSKAAARLQKEFQSQRVIKMYCAIVCNPGDGFPGDGWVDLLDHFQKDDGYPEITAIKTPLSRPARLRFRTVTGGPDVSLLLIELITGRKHQIRAQLAFHGIPVAGDNIYGRVKHFDGSILLHSVFIGFRHPVGGRSIEIFSSLPERFLSMIHCGDDVIRPLIYKVLMDKTG